MYLDSVSLLKSRFGLGWVFSRQFLMTGCCGTHSVDQVGLLLSSSCTAIRSSLYNQVFSLPGYLTSLEL